MSREWKEAKKKEGPRPPTEKSLVRVRPSRYAPAKAAEERAHLVKRFLHYLYAPVPSPMVLSLKKSRRDRGMSEFDELDEWVSGRDRDRDRDRGRDRDRDRRDGGDEDDDDDDDENDRDGCGDKDRGKKDDCDCQCEVVIDTCKKCKKKRKCPPLSCMRLISADAEWTIGTVTATVPATSSTPCPTSTEPAVSTTVTVSSSSTTSSSSSSISVPILRADTRRKETKLEKKSSSSSSSGDFNLPPTPQTTCPTGTPSATATFTTVVEPDKDVIVFIPGTNTLTLTKPGRYFISYSGDFVTRYVGAVASLPVGAIFAEYTAYVSVVSDSGANCPNTLRSTQRQPLIFPIFVVGFDDTVIFPLGKTADITISSPARVTLNFVFSYTASPPTPATVVTVTVRHPVFKAILLWPNNNKNKCQDNDD